MWGWLNKQIEDFEQKNIIEPGNEFIINKVGTGLKEGGIVIWDWFVSVLPDIMGYGTMATGALVILGAMVGREGMIKPLGYLSGGVILSLCVLMTAKG